MTWNSFTASWLNWYGARPEPVRPSAWPKNVLSLFAPSITTLLSVPRWPAKLMSPRRGSLVTPGVVRTKSMKLRPFVGRFWMYVSLTAEPCSVFVVSTTGVSSVTVTVDFTPARAIASRKPVSAPTVTSALPTFEGVKPCRLAETS